MLLIFVHYCSYSFPQLRSPPASFGYNTSSTSESFELETLPESLECSLPAVLRMLTALLPCPGPCPHALLF